MAVITVDIAVRNRQRKRKMKPRESESPNDTNAVLIAIDPGETTGWSLIIVDPVCLSEPNEKVLGNIMVHQHGEVNEYRGNGHIRNDGESIMCDDLAYLINSWPDSAVVIENFILRQKRKDRSLLSPVRVTAKLEQKLWEEGRTYFLQQPADAKTLATDERLKLWGMYNAVGGLEHARDADRHAILFLRRAKASARLRMDAWPHLYGKDGPYYGQKEN